MRSRVFWRSKLRSINANTTKARNAAVRSRGSGRTQILTACISLFVVLADPALAQSIDLSPIQSLLQGIVDALTGPLGVVIATLAVLGVFLSWFFNIIDLRQALWVLVGIAGVAAAPTIVAAVFSGGTAP
ncbi:Type IV secretion system protein virB2 [Falsiruegeria mediterranea M17]|uniref:Type IV secretion system protein virB2 n=1 Tax=Falsiruegeria mediterranea M17 TaxID=1200281 RepID=A0A2R8CFY1_9RHOB|nr:Type IV secretion system protein virB2 [Falsiruegeria mediterranea M17]